MAIIYSISFSNNYYINPLRILELYEEILNEFGNDYKLMKIKTKQNSMVFYTEEEDIPTNGLEICLYDKGIIIEIIKKK